MKKIKSQECAAHSPELELSMAARLLDLSTRFLPAIFFLLIVTFKIDDLISAMRRIGAANEGSLTFYISVASRVSVILFLVLMVVLFVIRTMPVRKAKGVFPRITAVTGTFLMSIITVFPRAELGTVLTAIATLFILLGTSLSIVALAQLGRSFSMMAEARRLVTSGPYAIVRHPLYLAEEIAVLGTVMQFFSIATIIIFVIHFLTQIQRMKNEEAVLRQAYPEYIDYQARTSRLIPKIY